MVVNDKDHIDVYLNLLPMKWSYTVAKASKKALAPERNIQGLLYHVLLAVFIFKKFFDRFDHHVHILFADAERRIDENRSFFGI